MVRGRDDSSGSVWAEGLWQALLSLEIFSERRREALKGLLVPRLQPGNACREAPPPLRAWSSGGRYPGRAGIECIPRLEPGNEMERF